VSRPDGEHPDDDSSGSGAARSEAEAWEQIVANYGERAILEPEPDFDADPDPTEPAGSATSGPATDPDERDDVTVGEVVPSGVFMPGVDDHPDADPVSEREERLERGDRFVPPPVPPLPRPTPLRLLAWAGTLGVPLAMLVLVVVRVDLPRVFLGMLIGWFAAGFLFLLLTMSRDPRDPWDDGSRV
jgi:hypothetical protein